MRQLIRDAIELHIEGMRENGEPVSVPSSRAESVDVDAAQAAPAKTLTATSGTSIGTNRLSGKR